MRLDQPSLVMAAALIAATCGATPEPQLRPIGSLEELEAQFEADAGKPRLVLLLSPT